MINIQRWLPSSYLSKGYWSDGKAVNREHDKLELTNMIQQFIFRKKEENRRFKNFHFVAKVYAPVKMTGNFLCFLGKIPQTFRLAKKMEMSRAQRRSFNIHFIQNIL